MNRIWAYMIMYEHKWWYLISKLNKNPLSKVFIYKVQIDYKSYIHRSDYVKNWETKNKTALSGTQEKFQSASKFKWAISFTQTQLQFFQSTILSKEIKKKWTVGNRTSLIMTFKKKLRLCNTRIGGKAMRLVASVLY